MAPMKIDPPFFILLIRILILTFWKFFAKSTVIALNVSAVGLKFVCVYKLPVFVTEDAIFYFNLMFWMTLSQILALESVDTE
jgi:uncharacterized membrane protein YobD (UPF0266 family)